MEQAKFKKGDRVCYIHHPDVCIGTISDDVSLIGVDDRAYHVFTSDDWFKHFCPYGGQTR